MYSNIAKDLTFIIDAIIEFALDFTSFNYNIITKKLDILDDLSLKENLINIVRKIAIYKLVLRNTLCDAIIYSSFGYFLSYPFMRAIVKSFILSNKQGFNK